MMLVLKEFIMSLRRDVSCEIIHHSDIGGQVGGDTWRAILCNARQQPPLLYICKLTDLLNA